MKLKRFAVFFLSQPCQQLSFLSIGCSLFKISDNNFFHRLLLIGVQCGRAKPYPGNLFFLQFERCSRQGVDIIARSAGGFSFPGKGARPGCCEALPEQQGDQKGQGREASVQIGGNALFGGCNLFFHGF